MKRLAAVAAAAGVLTASCSGGRSAGSLLPSGGVQAGGTTTAAAKVGARTTRDLAATAAPAGWANTATQAFALKNASDQGVLAATKTLTVHLGLQMHNADQLKSVVRDHGRVSPGAFVATYAPTTAEVGAVTSYLQSQGFTNVTVEPNHLIVSASATADKVSKAFDTTLHGFALSGKTIFANTTPAYVPQSLGGTVVAVLGLNNLPMATGLHKGKSIPAPVPDPGATTAEQKESPCTLSSVVLIGLPSPEPMPAPNQTGCLRNFTPSDYHRAYDAGALPYADGVAVAIMAEGDVSGAIADLRVNETAFKLPQVPVVVKQVGLPSTDTAGADEWTLDMAASSGMAGNVSTIYIYTTTSLTDGDTTLELNHWVTDDLTPIANASFGICEYAPYVDGSMIVGDQILLQAAAQGQTLFASTGDSGSFCSVGTPNGVPAGAPLVEYPATSSYAMAVGGTTLWTRPDGTYQGENSWDAGGGGISQFEYSPYWESGVQPVSTTPVGFTFRGVPDIAMDGDLQTGMQLYTSSTGWTTIGGTSLSSPLAAGLWARLLQANGSGLGFAPPRLYHDYAANAAGAQTGSVPPTQPRGGFHDILAGSNGLYTALPGWDATTGMGSLDMTATSAVVGN
jgi:pseudomonalisin